MQRLSLGLLVVMVIGCGGDGGDTGVMPLGLDTRIDLAPQSSDPDSGDTQMCVDDNGTVYVVWIDDRDDSPDVWFNRSANGGASWLPSAVKLNRGLDNNVWSPDVSCNKKGVYVVWEDDRDGALQNHQIYFNRSMDGGETWLQNDVLLELDAEGRSFSQGPKLKSVGDDLYAVWYDNANGAYDIFLAGSGDNGKTWRDPVRVDSDEPAGVARSGNPQIDATENGRVYVVWEDSRNGNSDIYFARSDNAGSSFKQDQRLDGGDDLGAFHSFVPRMSAEGDNVYVVWHDERNGAGRDIFLNYSADGGANWSNTAVRVDSDNPGFFNSVFPEVITLGNQAHVVWQDLRVSPGYDMYYRVVENGEPLEEEVRLDVGDDPGLSHSMKVSMSTNGVDIAMAWEDSRHDATDGDGYDDLFYNYASADGTLQETDFRIDSLADGESFKFDLNVHLHGQKIFTVWTDGRLGTADVYFKSLTLGEEGEFVEPVAEAR